MATRLGSVLAAARDRMAGWIPSRRHPTVGPDTGGLVYVDQATGRVHAYRRGQAVDLEGGGSGGSAAPASAQYLTLAADPTLTAERVLGLPYEYAGIDGGPGGVYRYYPFGDIWAVQAVSASSVPFGVPHYRPGTGNYQVSSYAAAVYPGIGRAVDCTSSSTAAWCGQNSVSRHCPFQGVIRWIGVLRTGADISDMRIVWGLMSELAMSPSDAPAAGDYIVLRLASGASAFALLTRDGTSTTATPISDVTVAASTVYALELLLDQTASPPTAYGRVWTYTAGIWTPGSWHSHTTNLPRTTQAGGDIMVHIVTAPSTSRTVSIARCMGWAGVSA